MGNISLKGVVEVHVHAKPDLYPDSQTKMYGSIVLNKSVGGVNPSAVETALKLGDKIVWMPTTDSCNERKQKGATDGIVCVENGQVTKSIEELQLGPTVLAGYSWGGVVCIAAAIEDKKGLLQGIMIADTGANAANHGDPDFPRKLEEKWPNRDLFRAFSNRCFAKPITRGMYQQLEDYAMMLKKDTVCQAARSVRESDFGDRLKEIACPVQILHGLQDQSRSVLHAQALKNGIDGAELFWLDCGHTPMVEVPKEYLEKLLYFVDRVHLVEDPSALDVLSMAIN